MKKKLLKLTAAVSAAALCLTSAPFSMGGIEAADELKVRDPFLISAVIIITMNRSISSLSGETAARIPLR